MSGASKAFLVVCFCFHLTVVLSAITIGTTDAEWCTNGKRLTINFDISGEWIAIYRSVVTLPGGCDDGLYEQWFYVSSYLDGSYTFDQDKTWPGVSYKIARYSCSNCDCTPSIVTWTAPTSDFCKPHWADAWNTRGYSYILSNLADYTQNWCENSRQITINYDPNQMDDSKPNGPGLNFIALYKKGIDVQDFVDDGWNGYNNYISPDTSGEGVIGDINESGKYFLVAWSDGSSVGGYHMLARSPIFSTPNCGSTWGSWITNWDVADTESKCSEKTIKIRYNLNFPYASWFGIYPGDHFTQMDSYEEWRDDTNYYEYFDETKNNVVIDFDGLSKGKYFIAAWSTEGEPVAKSSLLRLPCSPPKKLVKVAIPAAAIKKTSAKVKWTVDATSVPASRYELQLRKQRANGSWAAWSVVDKKLKDADNPYTLTNLNPNTKYQVQMRGVNAGGSAPWISSTTFKTKS